MSTFIEIGDLESGKSLLEELASPSDDSWSSESDDKLEAQLLINELTGWAAKPKQQLWIHESPWLSRQQKPAEQQLKYQSPQQSVLYRQQLQQQRQYTELVHFDQQQLQQQKIKVFHKIEQEHQAEQQMLEEIIRSPLSTSISAFSFLEDCSAESMQRQQVSLDREAEIQQMADYIEKVVERGNRSMPNGMSSKLKVHEVILAILLNDKFGDRTKDLRRILTFCDKNGSEVSEEGTHFKTLDTETMGLLWQKIKGNKQNNYDTFARAMRVRREKSQGYFGYMESGKRSKKRIYKFGDKAMEEMLRMKKSLGYFSRVKQEI